MFCAATGHLDGCSASWYGNNSKEEVDDGEVLVLFDSGSYWNTYFFTFACTKKTK